MRVIGGARGGGGAKRGRLSETPTRPSRPSPPLPPPHRVTIQLGGGATTVLDVPDGTSILEASRLKGGVGKGRRGG